MTFAEDGIADRVSRRSHEICGQQVLMGELMSFVLLDGRMLTVGVFLIIQNLEKLKKFAICFLTKL